MGNESKYKDLCTFDLEGTFGEESIEDIIIVFKDLEVVFTFDEGIGEMNRMGFVRNL